jgi:hypothetical protein
MKKLVAGLVTAAIALSLAASAAALTKPQAVALVQALLKKRAAACSIDRIYGVTATAPGVDRFRVTAKVKQAGYNTTLVFTVLGNKKIVAGGPLEAEIAAGHC